MIRIVVFLIPFFSLNILSQDFSAAELALKVHNDARFSLGIPMLEWSNQLAVEAKEYAEYLAKIDKGLIHSKTEKNTGENLYWICCFSNNDFYNSNPYFKEASEAWCAEKVNFHYSPIKNDMNFNKVGHYTQMIWSSTKQLGMGSAIAKSGAIYVVARYYPAGNYIHKYPY